MKERIPVEVINVNHGWDTGMVHLGIPEEAALKRKHYIGKKAYAEPAHNCGSTKVYRVYLENEFDYFCDKELSFHIVINFKLKF